MGWSEIGWTAGERMPINVAMRKGQLRSLGTVNFFGGGGGPRITNNYYLDNFYAQDYDSGFSLPGWVKPTFWAGLGVKFAGGMFSALSPLWSGGGGSSEGKGAVEQTAAQKQDLDVYKSSYSKNCTINGPLSNGGYLVIDTKTGKRTNVGSFEDLQKHLQDTYDKKSSEEPEISDKQKDLINENKLLKFLNENPSIQNASYKDGKFKLGEKEFENFEEFVKAAKSGAAEEVAEPNAYSSLNITKLTDSKKSPLNIPPGATTTASEKMVTIGDKKFPESYVVNDAQGKPLYKFVIVSNSTLDSSGNPKYTCTMNNGATLAQNQQQEYYLNSSGEFYQNDKNALGLGTALGKQVPQNK